MYVVSGCPRSGTSLMMDIFRESLGEDRIIGKKFPAEREVKRQKEETPQMFAYRRYLIKAQGTRDLDEARDMNPEGFWECPFTVGGAYYHPRVRELIVRIGKEENPSACKIVAQGLFKTNPIYVDCVVYMLRQPAAVAKSQERLRREMFAKHPETGKEFNVFDGLVVQSPQNFIEVTLKAADWFSAHPDVPLYIVNYERLLKSPKLVLHQLGKKIGEDLNPGVSRIRTDLNRSSGMTIAHTLMEEAQQVHDWFLAKKWGKLRKYRKDRATQQNQAQQQWFCARSSSMAQASICQTCMTDPGFREKLKAQAEADGVSWKEHPCAYECAFDMSREEYVSLQDSVEHNHWKEVG